MSSNPPPPPPPLPSNLNSNTGNSAPPPPPPQISSHHHYNLHSNDPVSENYHQLHSQRDSRPTHHRHRRFENDRVRGPPPNNNNFRGAPYERNSYRGRGSHHYGSGPRNTNNSPHHSNIPKIPTLSELVKETTITTLNGSSFKIPEILSETTFKSRYPDAKYSLYKVQHRIEILSKIFPIISNGSWFKEVWGPFSTLIEKEIEFPVIDFAPFLEKLSNSFFKDFKLSHENDISAAESVLNLDSTTTLELSKSHISSLCSPLKEMMMFDGSNPFITLSNIHSSVSRESLEKLCVDSIKECDSSPNLCYHLSIGAPQLDKSLYRMAWIHFDLPVEGKLLGQISSLIEANGIGFGGSSDRIYSGINETLTKKIKVLSSSLDVEIEDPELIFNSIKDFIPSEIVVKILEEKEKEQSSWWWVIDVIAYVLWIYYSINIWEGERVIMRHTTPLTIRSSKGLITKTSFEKAKSLLERIIFLKNLIGKDNSLTIPSEDVMLEDKWVLKVEDERYKCKECLKLFKGADFVVKHIRGKHEDISKAITMDRLSLAKWISNPPLWAISPISSLSISNSNSSHVSDERQKFNMRNKPVHPTPSQPPPPTGAQRDPRELQKYTDWDAPVISGDVEISYD